jgi:hypothetical protein
MRLRALLLGLSTALSAGADDAWDKVVLLQKVKRHIADGVKRLPDYTCLQTAARYRKKAGEPERLVDRVVLEVLNTGAKELYSSPGAKGFQAEDPGSFTGHGLSGTGAFGLFLKTLFVNDNGMFTYAGEETFRRRTALKWDYRVPAMLSGYTMHLTYSRGTVGMRGSFLVDAETLDLLSLTVNASEIPSNLPLLSATQTVDYARARIGERDVVLPQSASMKVVDDDGAHSRNEVEFTHCQSFLVESTLSFTAPTDGPALTALPKEEARPIDTGLTVTVELPGAVTEAHTLGALIEGRVVADVRDRGRVAVAAGSALRGRLRRLEQLEGRWAIGLEFTHIETAAGPVRFYANLVDVEQTGGAVFIVRDPKKEEELYLPYLPGVAQFFLPELPLPKGFKTVWKTTSPRPASR